jgi:thiol-disulfide isomerase/thioredoxin
MTIERVMSIAVKGTIALACVVVTINASLDIYERLHAPAGTTRPVVVPFQPGAKAPAVPGIDFGKSTRTLLLFVSTTCSHCRKSSPFYGKLVTAAARATRNQARLSVVAVFPQNVTEVDAFKTRMKLNIESVANVRMDSVGVTATPTMVLVSQSGRVARAWVGSEGKDTQDAVYSALLAGS